MINEAIILAGGLGTRLRSAVPDLPKCMAPVAGKPFLTYVIKYYQAQGITKFIFLLGYKHEVITEYLDKEFNSLLRTILIEDEPLGTGGAIYQGCLKATEQNVLVLNGDTYFEIDVPSLALFHKEKKADCTIALKQMSNTDRYGVVETDNEGRITSFKEKKFYEKPLINGGVYALNVSSLLKEDFPDRFSFEKDFFENYYVQKKIYGLQQNGYFIDIGIPEDYARAQIEFKTK
jgi:D-glycero-alpha-D-manno-heptose 1-phosphate guanylyltransferase